MREEEVKKTCLTSRTRWKLPTEMRPELNLNRELQRTRRDFSQATRRKDVLQWPVPMIQKKTGLPGDPLDAVVILYNNSKFQT